jgi:XRE family transcriptional regulator, regulator of sulfur utilization
MDGFLKKLGERLRLYRKEKGYSLEQLGELAGLHHNYIGLVERGEKNLTVESLQKLAKGLEVPLEQLFHSIDPMDADSDFQKLLGLLAERPAEDHTMVLQIVQAILQRDNVQAKK